MQVFLVSRCISKNKNLLNINTNRSIIQGLSGSKPLIRTRMSRNNLISTLTLVWLTFSSIHRLFNGNLKNSSIQCKHVVQCYFYYLWRTAAKCDWRNFMSKCIEELMSLKLRPTVVMRTRTEAFVSLDVP